jgi:aminopeptidase N
MPTQSVDPQNLPLSIAARPLGEHDSARYVRGMFRVIFLALLCMAASPADAQSTVTPGYGFEVERYAVALRPDLATKSVSGTETIVVRGTSDKVTQLAFSTNALRISEASWNALPVSVSSTDKAITFALPRALRRGERATLRFRVDGTPARGVTVIPGGIYTSYFACDWMVCLQDAPGDKAYLELDLLLPMGIESVGVGRASATIALPGGLVRHRWRSSRPYSSYLYAFAAGPFAKQSTSTPQGELVYLDSTGIGSDLTRLFAQSPKIAAFFADKVGMPLPNERYIQVLTSGRDAQESASFSLIGEAELDLEHDDPSGGWIIAHEMAHQWWGNLVTCATWQDLWLNEGITTFMVAAWKEHNLGEEAYQHELDVARRRVERVREIGFDKPLAWGGQYPSLGARRAVQYSKGALFLAHLREAIGDTAFWKGLRGFTRQHAGGTVTSADFQSAMQKASGRDLSQMFAEWVYGNDRTSARKDS